MGEEEGVMLPIRQMDQWLEDHKGHAVKFVRRRWPLETTEDAEGFLLPSVAGINEPTVMTLIICDLCGSGIQVALERDIGQDIT